MNFESDIGVLGTILGFIGLLATILIPIIILWKRNFMHRLVIIVLVLFLGNNVYLAYMVYGERKIYPIIFLSIPLMIFIIYYAVTYFSNDRNVETDSKNKVEDEENKHLINVKGNTLLDELLNKLEIHGLKSISTLQIIAETFNEKSKIVEIDSLLIINLLIEKIYQWMDLTNPLDRDDLDHLAGAAITTIANIAVVNEIEIGKEFIEKKIYELLHNRDLYSDAQIILNSIDTAKEIILNDKPNYDLYGINV